MSGAHRSAVVIARLLGVEGYTDHVHNLVETYWKKKIMDPRRAKGVERNEKRFSKLVLELDMTEKERRILGAFISLRAQMSFDAGLRIGLVAHAHTADKNIDALIEPHSHPNARRAK